MRQVSAGPLVSEAERLNAGAGREENGAEEDRLMLGGDSGC